VRCFACSWKITSKRGLLHKTCGLLLDFLARQPCFLALEIHTLLPKARMLLSGAPTKQPKHLAHRYTFYFLRLVSCYQTLG
jgi:hypothetical protein